MAGFLSGLLAGNWPVQNRIWGRFDDEDMEHSLVAVVTVVPVQFLFDSKRNVSTCSTFILIRP
jgi:hypothetical protein